MARIPASRRRELAELDAEARAFVEREIERQRLPAWIALYRRLKPSGRGEVIEIAYQRGAALRGREPVLRGALPAYAAIVGDARRLDPSARYLLRLWMAWGRRRQAQRRNDRAALAVANRLWADLVAHPPSLIPAARNIAARNVEREAALAPERDRCRAEAAEIWKATAGPGKPLSATAVAVRMANRHGLPAARVRSIRRWIANLKPTQK